MKPIIHFMRTLISNACYIGSILFMVLFIGFVTEVRSQFRGGEILYGCTSAGNIRFVMHLYRDCGSANTFADTLWLTTNATGFDSIGMIRVAATDISPECDCLTSGAPLNCSLATQYGTGAIEELVFSSDAFYPNGVGLMGVPPPTGWQFVFQGCCRAPTDNLAGLSNNFALTTTMFPYLQTPVNNCFDQSPRFLMPPIHTGCAGDPHALFQVPLEPEIDSLSFEITSPLTGASSPINTYQTGYSAVSPLPGPLHHPNNQAVTFDPVTGDLLFRSYTTGSFALAIKATAWKCGVKVTEIHREIHVLIKACHHGSTPDLAMQSGVLNQGILYRTDSLYAGESLSAWISALDTTGCASSGPHDVALSAVGAMFGVPMNSNGCLYGQCAQLTPPITHGGSLTDSTFVQTVFDWQTSGAHLPYVISCGPKPSQHDFVFIASNKKCPVPAVSYGVLRVALKAKEPDPPIPISCISVLPNGDVTLSWSEHTNTTGSFFAYELKHSTNPIGPYVQLTSIQNISQTSYTHQGANAHLHPVYYQLLLKEKYTGGVTPTPFDTAATPTLSVTTDTPSNVAHLSWQGIRDGFLPSSAGIYEVQRELQAGGWSVIGATTATSFIDTFPAGETLVKYKITLTDTVVNNSGPAPCFSESNEAVISTISVYPISCKTPFLIGTPVPNPASERVFLPVDVPVEGNLIVLVSDVAGKVIFECTFPVMKGRNNIPLEVISWETGIYFFTAKYGGMKQVIRLAVVR